MADKENKKFLIQYNDILRDELKRLQKLNGELEKESADDGRYKELRENVLTMNEIVKTLTIRIPLS